MRQRTLGLLTLMLVATCSGAVVDSLERSLQAPNPEAPIAPKAVFVTK